MRGGRGGEERGGGRGGERSWRNNNLTTSRNVMECLLESLQVTVDLEVPIVRGQLVQLVQEWKVLLGVLL